MTNDFLDNLGVHQYEKMFQTKIKTTLIVDDDGIITFPDEIIEKLGWKEGDVLEWIDNKDGSFSLKKPSDP